MKTLRTPSSPRQIHFQSWRLDPITDADATPFTSPKPFTSAMAVTSPTSSSATTTKPTSQIMGQNSAHQAVVSDHQSDQSTPARPVVSRHSILRRSSGFQDSSPQTSPISNGHESPNGENSPWSSAVGRATLGKSGRVIERLMADIDRLKRELNAEIQHRQEVEKQEEASKSVIRSLSAENSNLAQAKEVDAAMLKRRDRLVEELRIDLDTEKRRRLQAEEAAREATRRGDQIIAESTREVGQAREIAKHATTHAEILQQSHKQLSNEYRQRAETFAKDLQQAEMERSNEAEKIKRLDVVVEQLGQEVERCNRINTEMGDKMVMYREESERSMEELRQDAVTRQTENDTLQEKIQKVFEEAQWLLNLGKFAANRQDS